MFGKAVVYYGVMGRGFCHSSLWFHRLDEKDVPAIKEWCKKLGLKNLDSVATAYGQDGKLTPEWRQRLERLNALDDV
jgi:hypothetical protein